MEVTGGCHCGRIKFEAWVDPEKAMICHCSDCQTLSATAFRVNVPAAADDFRLIEGAPKEYVKIGDSGARRAQAFCENCGAQIYATNADGAREVYMLRAGVIEQRAELRPKFQAWSQSALTWLGELQNIPSRPKG